MGITLQTPHLTSPHLTSGGQMGGNNTKLSKEDEEAYKQLTHFTEKEVQLCYKRFSRLLPPGVLGEVDNINDPQCRVEIKKLLELPELKCNPFNVRLCRVFSGDRDNMIFEEFLDMMSVLSEYTPSNVKAEWAFRVFDFDGDGKLNKDDIYKTVSALTDQTEQGEDRESKEKLETEKREVVRNVLEETDLNGSGFISLVEFKQLVTKSHDFKDNFRMKL